jgi:hypothetical protein
MQQLIQQLLCPAQITAAAAAGFGATAAPRALLPMPLMLLVV